ncbi:hypothetical protein IPJ72_07295 [Candidatus Peregrinibacteria bacterium]|nr:MAG: hypothetical protein IPJ72_07295 [Candidatus Peregrinibacteria bacterium]
MVWSTISDQDLKDADATIDETDGIIDDLLTNAPGAEVVFLIKYNREGYVSTSMRSTGNQIDVGAFCAQNGGGGHVRAAGFKLFDARPFDVIAGDIVERVRRFQADRLHIDASLGMTASDAPVLESAPPTQRVQPTVETPSADRPKEVTYLNFEAPEPVVDRSALADVDRAEGQSANADEGRVVDSSNEDKLKTKSQKRREQRKRAKERAANEPAVDAQEKNVQALGKAFVSQPTPAPVGIQPVIEPVVVPTIEIQTPNPQAPNVQPVQVPEPAATFAEPASEEPKAPVVPDWLASADETPAVPETPAADALPT